MSFTPPPRPAGEYLRAVDQALRAGNRALAGQLAADAAAAGIEEAQLLQFAAHHHIRAVQFDRALGCAQRAAALVPRSPDALGTLGYCLIANNRYKEAATILDRALRIAPDFAPLRHNQALAQECLGNLAAARAGYKRTLEVDPRHAEAMSRAAYLAALQGDAEEARELGVRALALDPASLWAKFGLSLGELAAGELSQIEGRLAPVADDPAYDAPTRAVAHGILGDAFDAAEDAERAFSHYRRRGEMLRTFHAPQAGRESQLARVERMERYFAAADRTKWRGAPAASPVRTHAFLLGFARTGTTLLEQVLASHGAIEAMDERDCLREVYPFTDSDAALDRFATLPEADLQRHRELYWSHARDCGMRLDRPVFVDKMPLNSVVLCLIAKLFPQAKIVFALRDPRDVVFSASRRRFGMTPQMYELLTLESAAAYYDAVMSLVATYRRVLALDIHDLRYEDLIADFDGQCAKLCEFLGVEYVAAMRDFAQVARARDIDTPSAAQVTRGLYSEGSGQWRAYEKHLQPVMPLLAPWMARFGYGAQ